jgi:hypothetical protein
MEKVGVEALSQNFFSRLCSLQHRAQGEEPGSPEGVGTQYGRSLQKTEKVEVEVDPRPKMEKVGVEALSQNFFSRLCSLQHRAQGEEPGSPEGSGRHSTGGVYQQKTEKVEVEVDPHPKMEKVGVEALSQNFFSRLCSLQHRAQGEEPGSPGSGRHSTVREESTKKRKR